MAGTDLSETPQSAPSGSSSAAGEGGRLVAPPDEAAFAEAVRAALRHYTRTDLLRDNPLLASRLVAAALRETATTTPVQALREVLRGQCERLGDAPKLAALKHVLELTWFSPLRSQQVVAESLHLSWSTYRRRLADAVQWLIAQMWDAECALARVPAGVPQRRATDAVPAGEAAPSALPATGWAEADDAYRVSTTAASDHPAVDPVVPPHRHAARRYLSVLVMVGVAVAIAALVGWWLRRPHVSPTAPPTAAARAPASARGATGDVSIAVLPFLDMDADSDRRYLSDGLTEELINRLGRFEHLRVAARTSAFVFRDKPVDVRQAAHALGVANVLEGSVQRSGDRVRVRVALIDAEDGYELWADEYDLAARDLLTVEDEIAGAVIRELHPKLSAGALANLRAHSIIDPAAHDDYLVGLEYLNRRTTDDIDQAIVHFQRAIEADPRYAPAWSALATAYAVLRDYNSDAPPDTHYADAWKAADTAVALDPQLSRPHAVLAQLYEEHWQWQPAAREFARALQLDASDSVAHQWYAIYLWFMDDMSGALAQMRIARDLDPLSPIINADLGRALVYTGDVDGAIAQYRGAIVQAPNFALAHLFLAEALMAKGSNADALAETRSALALTPQPHPSSYLSMLGLAQALAGDRSGARLQLATLEARSGHQYVSGVSLALLDWQVGEKDRAFAGLARAVADHDHLMMPVVAARDADWRTDPRFATLLAQMGLRK